MRFRSHIAGTVLALLCVAAGRPSYSQRVDWRGRIDALVSYADSLSMLSQQTFHLHKFLPNDRPIRETWHFTEADGKVVIFEVHYFVDSSEFLEVYYLDNERVVCTEQYEIVYPKDAEDRIKWGAVGFFQGPNVRQFVMMGDVPENINSLTSSDLWTRFRSRFKELSAQRTLSSRHDRN